MEKQRVQAPGCPSVCVCVCVSKCEEGGSLFLCVHVSARVGVCMHILSRFAAVVCVCVVCVWMWGESVGCKRVCVCLFVCV